jgi:nucleoid-associated protein YgaU
MALFDREKTGSAVQDQSEQMLNDLKRKYASVLTAIQQQNVRLQNVHIENNKLLIRGIAPSQDAKNRVWDQIKQVDASYSDLTADITVDPNAGQTAAGTAPQTTQQQHQTYTVQSGDTLSKISKQFYGDANAYMKIFEANRDKLSDPNKISPGQQLVIPQK